MICSNCKKQIPDDSTVCPNCAQEVVHQEQIKSEISLRRYQRWIFYAIIAIVFVVMLIVILLIYRANSQLLVNIANVQNDLEATGQELTKSKSDLEQKAGIIQDLEQKIAKKTKEAEELQGKTAEFKQEFDEQLATLETKSAEVMESYEECKDGMNSADANVYSLIVKLGVGMNNSDLGKIALADVNLDGIDTDSDGLSDLVEQAIGTDINNTDSDNDGYDDKQEVLSGYNPIGEGSLGVDHEFAMEYAGKILLQVEGNGEAWYVAGDGKKYFLGNPTDAFKTMRSLEYWTKDWTNAD